MIEIEGLVVRYGDTLAVDELSLTIAEGAHFGLLGPNGAGKTTTLSCVCTLLEPTSGSVRVGGINVRERPQEVKKLLGLVPQSLALYPSLSVLDNLKVFGGLMELSGAKLKERVAWGLELSQLDPHKDKKVSQLSGGMKRRLNLACSLLHNPAVIICDEPTTGVDPQSRNHIFETIRKLQLEGATVVYTTHYMEEVEALCAQVAIMDGGKLIANDALENLLSNDDAPASYQLELAQAASAAQITAALQAAQIDLHALKARTRTLEEVFLDLTGRHLREDAP